MTLSEFSIRRPVFAWMLMAAIILFGFLSFGRLGLSQLPDVDSPVVGVSLSLPGAAPEVVESQVLDPIEDAIMELDGIKSVNSNASQNSGSISVEFEFGRDIDKSMREIQNKINQVQNILPINLKPPTVRKSNPEDQPILWVALTANDPNEKPIDMMIYARNYLYDQFTSIPGVGNVALGGFVDPTLRVWLDLKKLQSLSMTSTDLVTAITQEQVERPSGRLEGKDKEYNVRVRGEATDAEDFKRVMIQSRTGAGVNYKMITLGEVAGVEEGIGDVRKISRFNGKRAAALGILKQHGSNAVEVANLVRAKLNEIKPTIPKKYNVDIRSDNTRFIKQSVDELLFILGMSALLTSLVCYLFLGSWTSTINVLMAIPTSIIGTFTAFLFFGFTLNTFTLLGLSLAIGIVVDDAIMMLENIVRHRELGEGKREAAIKGSKEITFAALAATVAVVAIFLPVIFMQGVIGRYFLQFGITVTVAVLLSLLEALTLTPMRCSRFLHVDSHPRGLARIVEHFFSWLAGFYGAFLGFLLRHRVATLATTLALFAGSVFVVKYLPSEMLPAQDQSLILLRVKLPVSTALDITNRRMKEAEDWLLKQPEVTGVFSAVGGFGAEAVNQGMLMVSLKDKNERKISQGDLMNKWREDFKTALVSKEGMEEAPPGGAKGDHGGGGGAHAGGWIRPDDSGKGPGSHAPWAAGEEHGKWKRQGGADSPAAAKVADAGGRQDKKDGKGGGRGGAAGGRRGGGGSYNGMQVNFQDMSVRGFGGSRGFPIEFVIQGPDWNTLDKVSKDIMEAMRNSGDAVDVNTDVQPGNPELQLTPNRMALSRHGVSMNTITSVINTLVGGTTIQKENSYTKGGHRYPIELRLLHEQRESIPELNRIQVRNNRGEMVPFSALVEKQIRPSLTTISRQNRQRAITIYGNPAPGKGQAEVLASTEKLARSLVPPGYSLRVSGSSQNFRETIRSLVLALLLGILVSYMVLASQFNSFIHPVTVLMALPFSFSGAFLGLYLFHQSINIYSMIGLILLMGIVKKNSILLVDFTNQMRGEGLGVQDALLKACPVRLRPILMTSFATIAGALPEALSIGPGAETTIPMAIAIIGGVAASTLLTLFVVPCVYSLLSKAESPDPLEGAASLREAAPASTFIGVAQPDPAQ